MTCIIKRSKGYARRGEATLGAAMAKLCNAKATQFKDWRCDVVNSYGGAT